MRLRLLFAAFASVTACQAWGAQWYVLPSLALEQTYTDNISLTPNEFAEHEWITQIIPGISMTAVGTGLQFSLNYNPEFTFYARGQEENQIYHRGNAAGTAEVAEELLFVDAGASVDQYNVSLEGPITDDNINNTGNRATVGTFFVSPYLLHRFGTFALAQARYTFSIWNSDDEASFNNRADTIDLGLANGSSFARLGWSLAYKKSLVDYETEADLEGEVGIVTFGWSVVQRFRVFAQTGDENYRRVDAGEPTGEEAGGGRWGVGFTWAPSPRTNFTAIGGERFFGNTYNVDITQRSRLLVFRAGYTDDVTTTRTDFFGPGGLGAADYLNSLYSSTIADPTERQREVDSVIASRGLPTDIRGPVNFFSGDPFLQKRADASLALRGARNIVIATAYADARKRLPGFNYQSGDFGVYSTINQTGVNLAWNRAVGANTFGSLDGTYERGEFGGSERVDDRTSFGLGVTRTFQQRLTGSLTYGWQQNDSSETESSYEENRVAVRVRWRL